LFHTWFGSIGLPAASQPDTFSLAIFVLKDGRSLIEVLELWWLAHKLWQFDWSKSPPPARRLIIWSTWVARVGQPGTAQLGWCDRNHNRNRRHSLLR